MNIQKHIMASYKRLQDDIYSSDKVWQPQDYTWPADWEGRCLLALSCLNMISSEQNLFDDYIVAELSNHTNELGYMGKILEKDEVDEQQLSGHGWLLRGLVTYYRRTKNKQALLHAKQIVQNLFLQIEDCVKRYPLVREVLQEGDVSGHNHRVLEGWRVSTDIGCVFIALDGLTDYYTVEPFEPLKNLIDKLIEKFCEVDKVAIQAQTHATLTAARAILRMYEHTGEERYLQIATKEFKNYISYGMTETYENFNWFERPDTWTEPCAVVDSLILAIQLWKIYNEDFYKKMARRIWFNGLSFCHRANGGAGPNTCVTRETPVLKVSMFEAPFCCTMRYCEGLMYVAKHEKIFEWNETETVEIEQGRRFQDDILLVQNLRTKRIQRITELTADVMNKDEEYTIYFDAF